MTVADVIGWKFNHQPGMTCVLGTDGVWRIVAFPGPMPTQAELDQWTAEYNAWKAAEDARIAAIKGDAEVVAMMDRLANASLAQINNYVDNQVTDLASARTMFKRILSVMSAMLK